MPGLARLLLEELRRLLQWRRYVPAVARAARELLGPGTRVYVAGGAAEDRITILSDIDVVIVSPGVPRDPVERRRAALEIRDLAVTRYGLPWDYPVDLHLYTPEEFREARRLYRRLVPVPVEAGEG